MSFSRNTKMLFIVAVLFILGISPIAAQETNLLTNPGFEDGFTSRSGDAPINVALSWEPWHVPRTSGMPSFQNVQPKYIASSAANAEGIFPRTRNGSDAQIYYSFFDTHDGGLYQQVSGLTPGSEVRFSVYAHIWSSTFTDVDQSEEPGDVAFRVGIDPTGGTDGESSDVEYSTPAVFYDSFRQYSIIATAESDTITVFIRSSFANPVQNTQIYIDDAVLAVTSAPTVVPTDEPTDEPTNTPEPSATSLPATDEPTDEPTSTPLPTNTPDTDASDDPTPTREGIAPTDASITAPTATNPAVVPTATPIGNNPLVPTATLSGNVGGDTGNAPISDTFPGQIIHTVRSGDTVGQLSVLYGSSTDAIIEANGLDNNALIRLGQGLIIPVRLIVATSTPSPTPVVVVVTATLAPDAPPQVPAPVASGNTYLVQPGDTLSIVARRFNTTTTTLVQLNGIANPNRIFVGQVLQIPVAPTTPAPAPTAEPDLGVVEPALPTTYVVQPGDNLYRIALNQGVSLAALANVNNITNFNFIFVGQTLTLPR